MRRTIHSLSTKMSAGGYSRMDELGCIKDPQKTYQFDAMPDLRVNVRTRRKREFTPDEQKDSNYWLKRNRNNEAAKRSRQRKRLDEYLLETRAVELQRENENLKVALSAVNHHNTGLINHVDFAFKNSLGMLKDGCPRSLHLPTPLIPLHGLLHWPFSDRCGSTCPEPNHRNLFNDLASVQENVVNTANLQRIRLLDSVHPTGRYSHGTNTCTSIVYPSNRFFAYENYASQVLLGLPQYSSPVVNLSRNSRCYNARTFSSEATQNCMRQSGLIGVTREVPVPTNATEEICQPITPITQSVLLPHKLRYKVNNARFVAKYLS